VLNWDDAPGQGACCLVWADIVTQVLGGSQGVRRRNVCVEMPLGLWGFRAFGPEA
jgi:hypothetical protein